MRKIFYAALAALIIAPAASMAEGSFFYPHTSPEAVETIEVLISDHATGGCWTNLIEAQTYAQDQLRLKGYEITDNLRPGNWRFVTTVNGSRDGDLCFGYVETVLFTFTEDYGTEGILEIGSNLTSYTNWQNANILVLDEIKKAIADFPKR